MKHKYKILPHIIGFRMLIGDKLLIANVKATETVFFLTCKTKMSW